MKLCLKDAESLGHRMKDSLIGAKDAAVEKGESAKDYVAETGESAKNKVWETGENAVEVSQTVVDICRIFIS